ncbi:MAG: hypothetical protein EPO24_00725, partial [Bacteroidetes bacterium]
MDGDGIYKYNPHPPKFRHIKKEERSSNTLSGNFLRAIIEDSRNRVLIGTYEHGLTLWDKTSNRFTQYLSESQENHGQGKGVTVNAICFDKNNTMWAGTSYGLLKFNETRREFNRIMPNEFYGSPEVKAICQSRSGVLWFSTQSELFSFDPATGEFENMSLTAERCPGIKSASVRCIFEDTQGILWLGTYDGGINRFDPRSRTCTTFTHKKDAPTSLSHNIVNVIIRSENNSIWIGTEHGLNKFDPNTGNFIKYFEEDGLSSAFIYGILEDANNNLWISTNKGITCFNPVTTTFRNYGLEDGLQSTEFNSGAFYKNSRGEMYFGGINGFNIFHPDSIRDNPNIPQLSFTGMKKLDSPVLMNGEISGLSHVTFSYEEDIFSLRFVALEYSNPEKNQYAYWLEGFENNWIYCGTKREVRYTHLDAGEYIFHVKGSNNDGVWNERGISLKVIVVPPFWKTWWFLSISAIAALFSLGGTIRYFELRKVRLQLEKIERERAMERERARISEDMHDEIGANLTKIAIMSEIARRDINNSGAMEQHLQKISNTARDVVDSISEIVWAINPKNDRLDNLVSFIREYASGFFEVTEIQCRFIIPDSIPELPLSGEHRRNILLVVKEALTNAAKHSHATVVQLQFILDQKTLSIVIQDNGTGFSSENASAFGNGLFNMKKRTVAINGAFEIVSEKNYGTKITIAFNI